MQTLKQGMKKVKHLFFHHAAVLNYLREMTKILLGCNTGIERSGKDSRTILYHLAERMDGKKVRNCCSRIMLASKQGMKTIRQKLIILQKNTTGQAWQNLTAVYFYDSCNIMNILYTVYI